MQISEISRYSRAEDIISVLLRRVSTLWRRRLNEGLADIHLTEMQFIVLIGLAWVSGRKTNITQQDLSNYTKLSRALVSQIMENLVRKDLVSKTKGTDARTWNVNLTPLGEEKVAQAFKVQEREEDRFWAEIPELKVELKSVLERILAYYVLAVETAED